MLNVNAPQGHPSAPPARTVFAMALCAGLAVANIYYNQPMLALIGEQFGQSPAASLVPTATQLGYASGLMLLVPLGDLVERRRLIVIQFLALAFALVGAALAPTAWSLLAASFVIGIFSTVAQQIVPFAALLAPVSLRGKTIGKVMSGLLCGILFSRALSGYVASHWGWREMFFLGAPLAVAGAVVMRASLPSSRGTSQLSYARLLASLGSLWMRHPTLRRAAFTQSAAFASFIAFWTVLSMHLAGPPLGYGATVAGLFGVIGAVGVFAAPLAGHIADRRGPRLVIVIGAVLGVGAWLVFAAWPGIAGLIVGVIVLDFGVQSSLVSNQHLVYALDESARSRLNTVFMTCMFIGGAAGSALATLAWHHGGWPAACLAGLLFALAALVVQLTRPGNAVRAD